ncbi:hypothetical protein B0T20DRAFT_182506 [Sordaria brevicollis]|uniref:2EXR domain-containing protein n=1 Tax=Sordaria brevicollis TaxID=83679 RepID=A0AAE0UDQ8_SORBR|nr:hypothetical protein B0T20DRAFT_182506 [Sordaria brevicollis]
MSQTRGHAPRGTASVPNSNCHDDCSTGMLPSSELAKSDADNASGNSISDQPKTFKDLPQEMRDVIWKESLLDSDNYNKFSGCNVNPDEAFPPWESQHGPILLSSRAPTIAHLCQDARAAALKHHNQDWTQSGLSPLQKSYNPSPGLWRSTLLVPKSYNKLGYGVLAEELQREPFKGHSLLLDASKMLDLPVPYWYTPDDSSIHRTLQNNHRTQAYNFLKHARDDQVMVTLPYLRVTATFACSQWSQWKILACQVPDCNDDQVFAQLLERYDWDFGSFVYRDVYVDAQDHNALWCILRGARHFFPSEANQIYNASIHEDVQNALKSLRDIWVQKSRELSGGEEVMPRVKPVFKIRIQIELD